ncbi:MAG: hypothetical protein IJV01_05890 [Bacteroidales bacterium]|nr:hypothetical protein [Bacteroidales bacterium]
MTALLIVAGALSLEAQKIGGTRIEKGNDLAGVITDSSSGKGIPGEAFSRHDFTFTPLNRSEDDFVLVVLADPQCHFNREFERFKSESMPDLRTYVNRKIVARQSIPSSGLVHEYTASKIESGYEDL